MAAEALRHGFSDYFSHPLDEGELWSRLQQLAGRVAVGASAERSGKVPIVGPGPLLSEIRRQISLAARCTSNVLITGESGVGKELVARGIHADSPRRSGPFVCVNLAALPDTLLESELFGHERGAFTGAAARREGRIRQAHRGVLFLDEIGEMSLPAQAKILRAIEDREVCPLGGSRATPVDFRLAVATNRDLEAAVRGGTFRLDLYHRLNVVRLEVPPLRERREDIPALVEYFVSQFNRRFGLRVECVDPNLMALLVNGAWPGNIRELSNAVEVAFVSRPGAVLEARHLPARILTALRAGEVGGDKDRLVRALVAAGGNKSRAARKLNWSRMTVYRKMSRYRISSEVAKSQPGNKTGAAA